MSMCDLETFRKTPLVTDPYEYLVLADFIPAETLAAIEGDLPDVDKGGSFPLSALCFGPAFRQLADELAGDTVRAAFADKFEMDLDERPATLTFRGRCRAKDGKIHTDSRSKLITVLIYLNQNWDAPGGQLRLLRSNKIDDVIAEVPPTAGTMICFRNRENAWHGHTSYEGPRRAIQLNWVVDTAAADRSERRHARSAFWKNWLRKPSRTSPNAT